jgi:inorganic pyrophosphatase
VLGAFEVEQSKEGGGSELVRNDRLVAIPAKALRGAEWSSLDDIGFQLREQIGSFFTSYVERQGREIKLIGTIEPKAALKLVKEAKR